MPISYRCLSSNENLIADGSFDRRRWPLDFGNNLANIQKP